MTGERPTSATPWLSEDGATLMAIVNLGTDSFSDPRDSLDTGERIDAAVDAVAAGADVVDVGMQSAALQARRIPADEQIDTLVPVVTELTARGIVVSVDTYHPGVVEAALEAGATIINDFSGRADADIVEQVAAADAHYVTTHNPVGPRRRQTDPDAYDDVVADTIDALARQVEALIAAGVDAGRLIVDPGIDVGKTPRQTLVLLRGLDRVRTALPHPQLLAISRKDVLGVLTGREPASRDAATLALLGAVADRPRTLVRIHDVAAARDFLTVRAALSGRLDIPRGRLLADGLRRETGSPHR